MQNGLWKLVPQQKKMTKRVGLTEVASLGVFFFLIVSFQRNFEILRIWLFLLDLAAHVNLSSKASSFPLRLCREVYVRHGPIPSCEEGIRCQSARSFCSLI